MSWRIVGASVPGTLHLNKNLPCQDSICYKVLPHNQAVVAIADGAGFAARAEEGADLVVEHAVNLLVHHALDFLDASEEVCKFLMTQVFKETIRLLYRTAERENKLPEVYATTLTCVLANDLGLVVGQIGDGIAIAESASGSLMVAARPQKGEYANQSIFLTMTDAIRYLKVRVIRKPIRSFALLTDGLLRLALELPHGRPHASFFRPLIAFTSEFDNKDTAQNQLQDFLQSSRVCERTEDDKTIVLAVRTMPPIKHAKTIRIRESNRTL
ncbi:MAG TPA: PP2C family serine/threonine-protein phosphatase [Bacillota bacterium]|nr:PP2C family serine/threonine-protein phosphatase [Bacillota bacterium]